MNLIGMGRTPHTSLSLLTLILLVVGLVGSDFDAEAQTRRDIAILVGQVHAGEGQEVAAMLPALKKSHPDKAGVLFLEAMLLSNAEKAIALYQRVADEHRGSEWADDALYRLYQYSYAVGAYRTARTYAERLAKEHPTSPFLGRKSGTVVEDVAKAAPRGVGTASRSSENPKETPPRSGTKEQFASSTGTATEAQQYSVQVGAYSREVDAGKQVNELKERGYTAYVREKTVQGKTVYAVWLGIFPDFSQARDFSKRIKEQQNIDAIVVRR
ncbi:MAG: SPOR domain-containing protein [Bacteroidetes bacterium]|nr:SPOR domain-containing protein [Bacteroidota bacterium]